MRRIALVLGGTLLSGLLLLAALPAFAADTTISVSHAATTGQCSATNAPYGYEPASVSIEPGDTITFTNPRVHNNGCTGADHPTQCRDNVSNGTCPWGTEDLPPGASFQVTFDTEGTFPYRCVAHPYMEGTITVGDGDPSEPEPEPTSEPEPEPTSEPEPEPTSEPEPEPEPTSDEPSEPDATSGPTASDEPSSDGPTDQPDPDVAETPTPEPTTDPSSEPDQPDDDASEESEPVQADEVRVDPPGGGTGTKALATVLVLGTGGALWSVWRVR